MHMIGILSRLSRRTGRREDLANGHTKDFPAFAESFTVFGVDHINDRMTIVEVSMPNVADTTLATKIPELEDCGG
jgi:hypothetical protein